MAILQYDQELCRPTLSGQLVCYQEFDHSANYGFKGHQEILLTLTTYSHAIAPRTIILDNRSFRKFVGRAIYLSSEGLSLEKSGRVTDSFIPESAWLCLPIIKLLKNESAYYFLGWLEKRNLLDEKSIFLKSERSMSLFEEQSRFLIGQILEEVQCAWHFRDEQQVVEHLGKLLGLGVGLTPTGDDVLTGILASYFASTQQLSSLGQLEQLIKLKTNMVSEAELSEALQGRFAQTIQTVFQAIRSGNEISIKEAVNQLRKIGSTSGSDLLAGIIFGLKLFI